MSRRNTSSQSARGMILCHFYSVSLIVLIILLCRLSDSHESHPLPHWQAVPPPTDTAGGGRGDLPGGTPRAAHPSPPRGAGGGAGGATPPTPPTPHQDRMVVRVPTLQRPAQRPCYSLPLRRASARRAMSRSAPPSNDGAIASPHHPAGACPAQPPSPPRPNTPLRAGHAPLCRVPIRRAPPRAASTRAACPTQPRPSPPPPLASSLPTRPAQPPRLAPLRGAAPRRSCTAPLSVSVARHLAAPTLHLSSPVPAEPAPPSCTPHRCAPLRGRAPCPPRPVLLRLNPPRRP